MAKRRSRGLGSLTEHARKVAERGLTISANNAGSSARKGNCKTALNELLFAAFQDGKWNVVNESDGESVPKNYYGAIEDFTHNCIAPGKLSGLGRAPKRKTRKARR